MEFVWDGPGWVCCFVWTALYEFVQIISHDCSCVPDMHHAAGNPVHGHVHRRAQRALLT